MITVEKYFDDEGYTLRATFDVDSMANAIGCPIEHAGQFSGQFCVELTSCTCVETGEEHKPSSFEYEILTEAVMEEIACYRR